MKQFMLIFLFVLLCSCDITSGGDIFVMQKEDILGTWYGSTKVESQIQPGYYTDRPVTINIQDRDTSTYSLQDTFNITIQENISNDQVAITHFGYITDLKEEYEATLEFTFHKVEMGGTGEYVIYFTQLTDDSLKIQFSTYEFRVGK